MGQNTCIYVNAQNVIGQNICIHVSSFGYDIFSSTTCILTIKMNMPLEIIIFGLPIQFYFEVGFHKCHSAAMFDLDCSCALW